MGLPKFKSEAALLQNVPYRLRPKMHPMVKEALAQKELLFSLIEQYGSPLNLVFPHVFREKFELFDQMLEGEYLNYRLYYTCKPNRSNGLLAEAAALDAHVDVSSFGEFQAALKAGINPANISATGPKNKAYMDIVLQHQSLCVIDNLHELAYITANATEGQPCMLRLSAPQNDGGPSQDDTFGVPYSDLDNIIAVLKARPKLNFHGFACHYSGTFDPVRKRHIEQALKATLRAIDLGLMPCAINIGGGYAISYVQEKSDWQNFMTSLKQAVMGEGDTITWDNAGMGLRLQNGNLSGSAQFMDHYQSTTGENHLEQVLYTKFDAIGGENLLDFIRDSGLSLYVEPGRALMDQCGVTLASVNFSKRSSKDNLLINLDMHHANLNAHAFKYMAEPVLIHRNETLPANEEGVFYYGSLCFASDLITFHKTFPDHLPETGDIAAFINTAAYRMDFAESEMLRHPNAQKICVVKKGPQWNFTMDSEYTS